MDIITLALTRKAVRDAHVDHIGPQGPVGPKGEKGDTGGVGYVSFESDNDGHLYAVIAEGTDEISFKISDDGKLEVIYA